MDDGSTLPSAHEYYRELEPSFRERGWAGGPGGDRLHVRRPGGPGVLRAGGGGGGGRAVAPRPPPRRGRRGERDPTALAGGARAGPPARRTSGGGGRLRPPRLRPPAALRKGPLALGAGRWTCRREARRSLPQGPAPPRRAPPPPQSPAPASPSPPPRRVPRARRRLRSVPPPPAESPARGTGVRSRPFELDSCPFDLERRGSGQGGGRARAPRESSGSALERPGAPWPGGRVPREGARRSCRREARRSLRGGPSDARSGGAPAGAPPPAETRWRVPPTRAAAPEWLRRLPPSALRPPPRALPPWEGPSRRGGRSGVSLGTPFDDG